MDKIFAIHDSCAIKKRYGAFQIEYADIEKYNKAGYGIFHVVNSFEGARKKENCTKINYWIADIDDGTKEEQMERINKLILKPSAIVETKKGFHCYWKSADGGLENYQRISKGIIEKIMADRACKDPLRLLRYPDTYHLKDPSDPFLIKIVSANDKIYAEKKMLLAFEVKEEPVKRIEFSIDDLNQDWARIFKAENIVKGQRNQYFYWIYERLAEKDIGAYDRVNIMLEVNQKTSSPLSETEIRSIARCRN